MTLDVEMLAIAALAGVVLGFLYFGSLWFVVSGLAKRGRPGLLLLFTGAIRLALLLAGLWAVSRGAAAGILAALAGVIAARLALTRMIGGPGRRRAGQALDEVEP